MADLFICLLQPVVSESTYEPDSNLRVVKFDRTPIMSTYLVAYIVGEVNYKTSINFTNYYLII